MPLWVKDALWRAFKLHDVDQGFFQASEIVGLGIFILVVGSFPTINLILNIENLLLLQWSNLHAPAECYSLGISLLSQNNCHIWILILATRINFKRSSNLF